MNWKAAGPFIIGAILIALSLTYLVAKALLLVGVILAGAGILLSNLFKE